MYIWSDDIRLNEITIISMRVVVSMHTKFHGITVWATIFHGDCVGDRYDSSPIEGDRQPAWLLSYQAYSTPRKRIVAQIPQQFPPVLAARHILFQVVCTWYHTRCQYVYLKRSNHKTERCWPIWHRVAHMWFGERFSYLGGGKSSSRNMAATIPWTCGTSTSQYSGFRLIRYLKLHGAATCTSK